MSPGTVHRRLVERSIAGKYDLFLGLGGGIAVLGLILFVGALQGDDAARAWQLFHVNWLYFTGLAGGSVAFTAVQKITNAKWSGLLIRFAEASVAFLPLSLIGLVLIFTLGYPAVYGPMEAAAHGMMHSKQVWLSWPFMFGRLAVGLALLCWVGWKLIRADLIPDMFDTRSVAGPGRRSLYERWTRDYDGTPPAALANEERLHRLAPLFVVLYVIVFSLVAFDGIMALQPHWFSNLLGGFYFMGSFLGAHMLLAILGIYGSVHLGITDLVSPKQRHDLGKLCFGFTVFWTYLMWAQFLVIWYGNLPEETGFVFARLWGNWRPIGIAVGLGMFVIPFFGLLGVTPKKIRATFIFFATVSLVSLWLERYLLVMPSVTALPQPVFGQPEAGPTLLFLGCYLLSYALFARTFPTVSPRIAEITLDRERGHAVVAAEFEHEESSQDYVAPDLIERRERPR
jgi:hypothetical protein